MNEKNIVDNSKNESYKLLMTNPANKSKQPIFSPDVLSLAGFCSGGNSSSNTQQSPREIMSSNSLVTKSGSRLRVNISYHKYESTCDADIRSQDEIRVAEPPRNFREESWNISKNIASIGWAMTTTERPAQLYEPVNNLVTHITALQLLRNDWTDSILATRKLGRPDIRKGGR